MTKVKKRVYLAGGFNSRWQDLASRRLDDFLLLDPSSHNIQDPAAYTEWDLRAIRECDLVLANMEESNPGGYALAMEVGYAKALGKHVVFVDQLTDSNRQRYFEMVRQAANRVFLDLPTALEYIAGISENGMFEA